MSSKHQGSYDQSVDPVMMSITPVMSYEFKSPDPLLPHRSPTPERPGQTQAGNKGKWPIVAKISSALNPWWNAILVTSCVIAVLFDPLFFYIPYTSEEEKCMGIDKRVKNAALAFRSVTDVIFLVHIIYQLSEAIKYAASTVPEDTDAVLQWECVSRPRMIQLARKVFYKLSWRFFLVDVFAILPLPQLLIVRLFFDIGGSNYLLRRKVVSGFLLVQYVPRIYRIYLSSAAVTQSPLWVKGVFNFFLYILASHVLGAFWYFFSIQRETSCWYRTCIDTGLSESACTFYCNDDRHSALMASTNNFNGTLNEKCILKVPYDITDPPFDFGIFFDALKNDIQGKINVPKKIGYCFWWGLRNLSNFGTSLETSTYLWENSFAILISITGLLLFLYLIGNVQIYMERATIKKEDLREKLKKKETDVVKWIKKNDLPEDIQKEIMINIKQKLEEDLNANLEDLFSILPWYTKKYLKRALCMKTLENVPMLKKLDGRVLKMMCDYLKPVNYQENTMVFHMGAPLDRMVFITQGSVLTYTTATESSHYSGKTTGLATSTSMVDAHSLEKGDYYGHELLEYASPSLTALPTSPENVRCHTNVEAFVLMAKDLKTVVIKCEEFWPSKRT